MAGGGQWSIRSRGGGGGYFKKNKLCDNGFCYFLFVVEFCFVTWFLFVVILFLECFKFLDFLFVCFGVSFSRLFCVITKV